tara:strand:+ start:128 stop:643 length:516 start_codon:yes stop_codon:yes gene_type:complete
MNSNQVIEGIKNDNPDKNIKVNVMNDDITTKFKDAVIANKEFIKALIFIGRNILNSISLPTCIKKLGYDWFELSQEGLILVKKLGNTLKIDCIPFDILGIFAIHKHLASLGFKMPFKLPNFKIINDLISLSSIDILAPIKQILNAFNFECLTDIRQWNKEDYVYNCLKNKN